VGGGLLQLGGEFVRAVDDSDHGDGHDHDRYRDDEDGRRESAQGPGHPESLQGVDYRGAHHGGEHRHDQRHYQLVEGHQQRYRQQDGQREPDQRPRRPA
jgi:hypothetical protein